MPGSTTPAFLRRCWLALAWLGALPVALVLWPLADLPDPDAINLDLSHAAPSRAHWLGTDGVGRDMLARVVQGATAPLTIGALALGVALLVTHALRTLGHHSNVGRWLALPLHDTFSAMPALLAGLAAALAFGASALSLGVVLGLISAPAIAQARRPWAGVAARITAGVVLSEGALAFLGFGALELPPSWGAQLARSREHLEYAPHVWLAPAAALTATTWALHTLADALDAQAPSRGAGCK